VFDRDVTNHEEQLAKLKRIPQCRRSSSKGSPSKVPASNQALLRSMPACSVVGPHPLRPGLAWKMAGPQWQRTNLSEWVAPTNWGTKRDKCCCYCCCRVVKQSHRGTSLIEQEALTPEECITKPNQAKVHHLLANTDGGASQDTERTQKSQGTHH
jgi:hypothetical protein